MDRGSTAAERPRPIAATRSAAGIVWRHRLAIGLAAAIALGIVFRLMWNSDIEYKGDENWMVVYVRDFWQSYTWSTVGMPSSVGPGLPHPGLGPWLFVAIGGLLPKIGPLELARSVETINIIAILAMLLFAQYAVARSEREPWLWAVALFSVNPLAVIYSRKLWTNDVMPLFTLAMLWAWWYRGRRWGAFLWGLMGALHGQVHLTGFVFAAAFFGFVLVFDRRSVRWRAWFAGSLLGLAPALPWFLAVVRGGGGVHAAQVYNPLIPFGHWLNFALGIDLFKALGDDFLPFLAFPQIYAHATYLAGAVLAGIVVIFAVMLRRLLHQLYLDRARTVSALLGTRSSTSLAFSASFFGYCSLLAAMAKPTYLHYVITALPMPALWLAWIARAGCGDGGSMAKTRGLLAALATAQAGLTLLFLAYIHQTQVIHGDYGVAYGSQARFGFRP